MLTIKQYLHEYQKSHVNPTNVFIHKICVPLIFFSIIGLLYCIPVSFGPVKLVAIICSFAMVYYLILSRKYFFIMLPQMIACYYLCYLLDQTGQLLNISIVIFIISWVFQIWGHKIEGKKPSFLQDLTFLLIGPIWVVKKFFKIKD